GLRRYAKQVVATRRRAPAVQVATELGSSTPLGKPHLDKTADATGIVVAVEHLGLGLQEHAIETDALEHHPAKLRVPLPEDLLRRQRLRPEDHLRRNNDAAPEQANGAH